ncbi:transposase-like protein [Alloprevotella rava]|uniref:Transposase-like protein n=1 Tax=Alloprevotella rava TaxID=671218 RepID=A0A7W5UJ20_9BACT|nr:hypothetical protein [Alloprevotella rava]MBB3703456.1 transposase-like protein [Alloprevotella rava]
MGIIIVSSKLVSSHGQVKTRYISGYRASFRPVDTTFSSTRRNDSVSQEAYYTMLGLLPDGTREVLCGNVRKSV